jgi:hypothetical protein
MGLPSEKVDWFTPSGSEYLPPPLPLPPPPLLAIAAAISLSGNFHYSKY